MDRGTWQATVHGVTRVGHDLVTKPQLDILAIMLSDFLGLASRLISWAKVAKTIKFHSLPGAILICLIYLVLRFLLVVACAAIEGRRDFSAGACKWGKGHCRSWKWGVIPGQAPPCLWGQRALPGMGAYCGRSALADAARHLLSLGWSLYQETEMLPWLRTSYGRAPLPGLSDSLVSLDGGGSQARRKGEHFSLPCFVGRVPDPSLLVLGGQDSCSVPGRSVTMVIFYCRIGSCKIRRLCHFHLMGRGLKKKNTAMLPCCSSTLQSLCFPLSIFQSSLQLPLTLKQKYLGPRARQSILAKVTSEKGLLVKIHK